ncbi:MAG: sigma-70 family RNA polymerase sigma factor [Nanoarchaeota archaeon]
MKQKNMEEYLMNGKIMLFKEKKDLDLVNNVKINQCEDSLKELMNRHMPLCNEIYRRYSHKIMASGGSFNDLYDDRFKIFWQSITSFNPDKQTKFSTWLGHRIRYQCLTFITQKNKMLTLEPENINFLIDNASAPNNNINPYYSTNFMGNHQENNDLEEYVDHILSQLKDERIKKIFELKLIKGEDLTWKEIGDIIGVSSPTAVELYKKGKKILKEKLQNGQLFDII